MSAPVKATPPAALLYLSEAQAALKVGKTGLYRLMNSGQIAWVQVGAHRRIASTEIDRFITENTRRSA
ncbi:hypothetical protein MINS_12030 [Mycolicibacterium insubricum]|uniref:Uncharacterized protein n=1 Tax=Mycolicibacterium insubricum TaxID=444597 RepID=A0A1X0CXK9_9MYCO|nr:helix-turn-helix domain-containing protein [Mycolicibacterium insubricum]MCV7079993.1 helix-turn-helix domain-containing protein [Mycolicibacterium insubricum]ORA64886.1 hypothetical protein BST26_19455 [Mycolicibacterium insubricum]BBZ65774.1 hypothetical protein MINS_12030 [Mycolicibacterium insubricum]